MSATPSDTAGEDRTSAAIAPPRRPRSGGAPVAPVRYPLDLSGTVRALLHAASGRAVPLPGTLTGSGEDALVVVFESLVDAARLARGDSVVLPDFVCSSVPRALERAGLRAAFAALDPACWGYASGALEAALDAGARAFVAVSYFGLPPGGDAAARARLDAAARRAVAVEDLAQAYGIAAPARLAGAAAAAFSFGRGKSLPLAWGGLAETTDRELAACIARRAAAAPAGSAVGDVLDLLLAQVLRAALHPAVWRFVPLPAADAAAPPLPTRRAPGRAVAAYLATAATRHQAVVAERRRNALALHAALAAYAARGLTLPDEASLCAGVALRMPVVFPSAGAAAAVRDALAARRIVKGPNAWDDYGRTTANASALAARLVTLPTQPGSAAAARRAVAVIRDALGG